MASFMSKLLVGALPLSGGLSQQQTNGNYDGYPELPEFLTDNPMKDGFPWGSVSYDGDTVHQNLPMTGVTRYYDFNVSRAILAPDGVEKDMIVINGQFPGPLIEANWGDWIQVTVTNNIVEPEEGTTIHWHAFLQKETPWYDGVASVQQCPITPEKTFTYRFRADHVGSSFYHSHYSAQVSAGVLGPMVIYGPKPQPYDHDMGPVLLTDWFHTEYFKIIEGVMGTDPDLQAPFSDNNLINGKNNFDCSTKPNGTACVSDAGVSKFLFKEGESHLLRLINGGSAGLQYFSVDEHEMTVISNDFIPIEPYKTNVVTLGVGQRTDVIVHGKNGTDADRAYWMRGNLSATCALPRQALSLAAIYYNEEDFNANTMPDSTAEDIDVDRFNCGNEPLELTKPLHAVPVAEPEVTIDIDVRLIINETDQQEWLMNDQTFRANYNHPIMLLAHERNYSYPFDPQWNVINTSQNKTVRVVWHNEAGDTTTSFAHPLHLHGHDFQVLAAGPGEWDGTVVNPDNALRRDTHILPPAGHLVVQFEADNPGIWPFHCHVAWHVSSGFYVNMMERPEDLRQGEIPMIMDQTCKDWQAWSKDNIVNQIDSGLKARQVRDSL